jgi:hypothetical protein
VPLMTPEEVTLLKGHSVPVVPIGRLKLRSKTDGYSVEMMPEPTVTAGNAKPVVPGGVKF